MSNMLEETTVYKPFKYPWAMEIAGNHEDIHWTEKEAEIQKDIEQWHTVLNDFERSHILSILRLFTQGDVLVGGNYVDILPKFKNNEIRSMLLAFACREGIHQRAYAFLNDTLGLPDEEFSTFLEYKEMVDKCEWMQKTDTSSYAGIAQTLAKMVFSEGVVLFASFIMLLNYGRQGKMLGMNEIVEWSIRDETMHVEGNTRLFRTFCEEHPRIVNDEFKAKIYQMARDVVDMEDKFIDLAFSAGPIDGLTPDDVKDYIRYICDRRLIQLGLKPNFGVKELRNKWVAEQLNATSFKNFFEGRVTEYGTKGMSGTLDWGKIIS